MARLPWPILPGSAPPPPATSAISATSAADPAGTLASSRSHPWLPDRLPPDAPPPSSRSCSQGWLPPKPSGGAALPADVAEVAGVAAPPPSTCANGPRWHILPAAGELPGAASPLGRCRRCRFTAPLTAGQLCGACETTRLLNLAKEASS
jgi:hypothetical protein